jgi:AcrR family transcriptional regulator
MNKEKRPRLLKEASREKVLIGSLELISREGWSGLTFQKISKLCRMSPSNVIYHFANRADLLRSLLDHISQNNWRIVAEAMTPELDAYQRLIIHFEKNLEWAREFPSEAQVIAQIYAESGHDSEFAPIFAVMFDRAQGRIREYLLAGQREGLFHFEFDSVVLARLLHNMLVGAFINTIGTRHTKPVHYKNHDLQVALKNLVGVQKRSG